MGYIIFLIGLAICVFSHPKIMRPIMARLMNEGIVTPKAVKPEDAEIIKYAGPNLSLFFFGMMLMLLAVILQYI